MIHTEFSSISDYIADLLSRIFDRRRMYTTISEAQEDFRIGYDTLPSLTVIQSV